MTPEEIARSERYELRSKWHRDQRVLKLRFGTVEKWKKLASRLNLTVEHAVFVLLELYLELTLTRKPWLSVQELARRLAPSATAWMVHFKLAENRNGQVFILDVERTVGESQVRRDIGLRALPAKRAHDLASSMLSLAGQCRGQDEARPLHHAQGNEQQVIELLRARANDRTILDAWKRAMLSTERPRVETFADLNRTWARWAK